MKTLNTFLSQVNVGQVFGLYLPTDKYTSVSVFTAEDGAIERVSMQGDVSADCAYIALSIARRAELLSDLGRDLEETTIVRFVRAVDGLHLLA
jgi:hypothetical protein